MKLFNYSTNIPINSLYTKESVQRKEKVKICAKYIFIYTDIHGIRNCGNTALEGEEVYTKSCPFFLHLPLVDCFSPCIKSSISGANTATLLKTSNRSNISPSFSLGRALPDLFSMEVLSLPLPQSVCQIMNNYLWTLLNFPLW